MVIFAREKQNTDQLNSIGISKQIHLPKIKKMKNKTKSLLSYNIILPTTSSKSRKSSLHQLGIKQLFYPLSRSRLHPSRSIRRPDRAQRADKQTHRDGIRPISRLLHILLAPVLMQLGALPGLQDGENDHADECADELRQRGE